MSHNDAHWIHGQPMHSSHGHRANHVPPEPVIPHHKESEQALPPTDPSDPSWENAWIDIGGEG
jgi:hypothetical protein